jgi:enoyl-CoA hydratase/carnithine racemase
MSAPVLTDLADNGVLTITLNRPEVLNSLDESLTLGLVDAMHEAKTDSTVRAVVITGAGRAFVRVRI